MKEAQEFKDKVVGYAKDVNVLHKAGDAITDSGLGDLMANLPF